MLRFTLCCLSLILLGREGRVIAGEPARPNALVAEAAAVLDAAFRFETSWKQVHAAEAWVALGEATRVRSFWEQQLAELSNGESRVGVWRVMATLAPDLAQRMRWVRKIEMVLLDPEAPDRLQALESLAKLGERGSDPVRSLAQEWMAEGDETQAFYGTWFMAQAGETGAWDRLVALVESPEAGQRRRAGYALTRISLAQPESLRRLAQAADREPVDLPAHPYLLVAALHHLADPERVPVWRETLSGLLEDAPAKVQLELNRELMRWITPEQVKSREAHFEAEEADARIGAAWAVLHVAARHR